MEEVKINVEEWADKILTETVTDNLSEMLKEELNYGSLLYAQDEKGELQWLKRMTGEENFEVKPVSILNGQIIMMESKKATIKRTDEE